MNQEERRTDRDGDCRQRTTDSISSSERHGVLAGKRSTWRGHSTDTGAPPGSPRRVHLGSCLAPFCRFLSHAPCLSGSQRGGAGARGRDRAGVAACTLVACRHRPADSARGGRHDADAAGRAPQLSADRPLPLPARADPARDQSVLRREQSRRPALQPQRPLGRLSARQGRARHAAVRHAARRLCRGLRMDQPFAGPGASRPRAQSRARRRPGVHAAVLGVDLQRVGDELRLAQQERDPGAQCRREGRRIRAQHRRRRPESVPPRTGRRFDLADRHRLLQLPHA